MRFADGTTSTADSMSSLLRNLTLITTLVLLASCLWGVETSAANISEAHDTRTGKPLYGVLVEGDIQPGDALQVENAVITFDIVNEPRVARFIYLRSKGGDVGEAMKIGTFVRRLRLETEAPTQLQGHSETSSWVSPSDKSNNICASACFLIYAGGVERHGNLLALHRPYFPIYTGSKLSDLQHEAAERQAIAKVRQYLKNMEIDDFFIDKLISTNSQDAYYVTLWETDEHHLSQIVPSLEEAVLTRCTPVTAEEAHRVDSGAASAEERERLISKLAAAQDCEEDALNDMRQAAFKREMTDLRH